MTKRDILQKQTKKKILLTLLYYCKGQFLIIDELFKATFLSLLLLPLFAAK